MDKDFENVVDVFAEISDKVTMKKFIREILTPKEQHDVALRWRLMNDLKKGKPQREIASDLGISLCKITRGSKILKDSSSACSKLIV